MKRSIFFTKIEAELDQWSGRVVYSDVRAAQTVVGLSPETPPMLADMSLSMWIKKAWLPCWPLYSQQVLHQRWIWGSHKWVACKGSTLGLKPRADITRSPKPGYQWPHEKDLCPPPLKKPKKKTEYFTAITVVIRHKRSTFGNNCLLLIYTIAVSWQGPSHIHFVEPLIYGLLGQHQEWLLIFLSSSPAKWLNFD